MTALEKRRPVMARQSERHTVGKIEAEGVVCAVEIDDDGGGRFKLLLDNGDTLAAPFTSKQDMIVTNALHLRHTLRLSVAGPAEFDAYGKPRRLLRLERCEPFTEFSRAQEARVAAAEGRHKDGQKASGDDGLPIWDKLAAIGKSAPEGTWDDFPTDGSINYKHYLYGHPKREV